jgi:hypothetical protein
MNFFGFLFINVSYISSYDKSISNTLASLPSFSPEWLSELDTKLILSNCDNLQFILGSELKPVSITLIKGVNSSKHSSIVSNPDIDPNKENQGVQI